MNKLEKIQKVNGYILLTALFVLVFALLGAVLEEQHLMQTLPEQIEITRVERTEQGQMITLDINGQLHDYYYEY